MTIDFSNLDKRLAHFMIEQVPIGTGPDARSAALCALADVLGMYLAGNLAKEGPAAYRETLTELIERTHGVAQASAVQLRAAVGLTGLQSPLGVADRDGASPPTVQEIEARDPTGQACVLLSSLGALIYIDEPEFWRLPGFPEASARIMEGGEVEIVVAPQDKGEPATLWRAAVVATSAPDSSSDA